MIEFEDMLEMDANELSEVLDNLNSRERQHQGELLSEGFRKRMEELDGNPEEQLSEALGGLASLLGLVQQELGIEGKVITRSDLHNELFGNKDPFADLHGDPAEDIDDDTEFVSPDKLADCMNDQISEIINYSGETDDELIEDLLIMRTFKVTKMNIFPDPDETREEIKRMIPEIRKLREDYPKWDVDTIEKAYRAGIR